jgi:acetylornithine deacetylase
MNSVEILERLVAFRTVSRNPNLDLIHWVREFLSSRGIDSRLYPDDTGGKANLYATIGPTDRGGILLSGHTDVVPVDGQRWSTDPFSLFERDGQLFGRGTADMKGFLACALRAADLARTRDLATPLHLAFSYDEETGCIGVRSLIEDMARWAHRPRLCIVGEPTMLRTALGHKGKSAFTATCKGRAAHSANPAQGINAIHLACDLIGTLRRQQELLVAATLRDPAYEVPYSTVHVGTIQGGTVLNIVPPRCELEFEIRNLPGENAAHIAENIRCQAEQLCARYDDKDARIDLAVTNQYPGLETPEDSPVVALLSTLTGNRSTFKVGFGSEAGLFSGELGIPTAICGPGSIDQAHKPDEFISRDQLLRCDALMDALLQHLASR